MAARGAGMFQALAALGSGASSSDEDALFDCVVCLRDVRTLSGPIWQCPEGHVFCTGCRGQVGGADSPCPSCLSPLGNIRNRIVEKQRDLQMRKAGLTAAERAIPQAAAPLKAPGATDSRGVSVDGGASADDGTGADSQPGGLSKSQKKRQKERLRKEAGAEAERQREAGMPAGSSASTNAPILVLPTSLVQVSGSAAKDAPKQATSASASSTMPPVGAVSGGTMAVNGKEILKGSQAGTEAIAEKMRTLAVADFVAQARIQTPKEKLEAKEPKGTHEQGKKQTVVGIPQAGAVCFPLEDEEEEEAGTEQAASGTELSKKQRKKMRQRALREAQVAAAAAAAEEAAAEAAVVATETPPVYADGPEREKDIVRGTTMARKYVYISGGAEKGFVPCSEDSILRRMDSAQNEIFGAGLQRMACGDLGDLSCLFPQAQASAACAEAAKERESAAWQKEQKERLAQQAAAAAAAAWGNKMREEAIVLGDKLGRHTAARAAGAPAPAPAAASVQRAARTAEIIEKVQLLPDSATSSRPLMWGDAPANALQRANIMQLEEDMARLPGPPRRRTEDGEILLSFEDFQDLQRMAYSPGGYGTAGRTGVRDPLLGQASTARACTGLAAAAAAASVGAGRDKADKAAATGEGEGGAGGDNKKTKKKKKKKNGRDAQEPQTQQRQEDKGPAAGVMQRQPPIFNRFREMMGFDDWCPDDELEMSEIEARDAMEASTIARPQLSPRSARQDRRRRMRQMTQLPTNERDLDPERVRVVVRNTGGNSRKYSHTDLIQKMS